MAPTRTSTKESSSARRKTQKETVPGVQKIKSALRQTRRLLAKDNLAANVRVETERRLKSLEHDLELAEKVRKERSLATKYHKVKFFERQKACRKINQTKRAIESETSRSAIKEIQQKLQEHRIDLNYILHYPKNEKYISLFPSDKGELAAETLQKRNEMRQRIRTAMENGELDPEPEIALDKGGT